MGSYALPVKHGRLGRRAAPRHCRHCLGKVCADAPYALPGLLGRRSIAFLFALILMIFGLNVLGFLRSIKRRM